MRGVTGTLMLAGLVAVLAGVVPARAEGAVITFDDLGVPAGGRVTVNSQYSGEGVTFNDVSATDYSQPPFPAGFAHSGTVGIEQCFAVEFCATPITASFTAPQQTVKVWVGASFALPAPLVVRLTAFDADHVSVGSDEAMLSESAAVTPIQTPLEVTVATPTIRSLEVSVPGGYTSGVAVDDLEFSAAGPPPPCGATSIPTVRLTQPTSGLVVQNNEFLLEGTVETGGAPIESASIIDNSQQGVRTAALYPSLIQAAGGSFGPGRFGGLLSPGENKLVVTARNCLGTGASGEVIVSWSTIPSTCPPAVEEIRLSDAAELSEKLRSLAERKDPYPVRIIVPKDVDWAMTDRKIPVSSGVQIVGERGDLGSRPLLHADDRSVDYWLFEVTGNDVCVEGLHIRGPKDPSKGRKRDPTSAYGIKVIEDAENGLGRRVIIADNEFDWWSEGGILVIGSHGSVRLKNWDPSWAHLEPRDAGLVRIEHNYFHHNAMNGAGYGAWVGGGGYATFEGNVFDFNRHALAASGKAYSGYVARFNYVLQGGYKEGSSWNQQLDVHGENEGGYGGNAGEYFELAYNTVRGEQHYALGFKTRAAFMLRGRPRQGAFFHDNVLVHDDLDAAVALKMSKGATGIGEVHRLFNFHAGGNHFNTDYSTELAAGDFDGDGRTDVFVANGTAWFFSRAGIRPWEFLHASNKRVGALGFADIDNDGVTDVLYRDSAGNVGYLKSGRAGLAPLTSSPVPMKDMRFGDFDGDGLTDIFYRRGGQWWVWYGSKRAWTPAQTSSKPISELLFGEFDDVPGTDVAAVTSGMWAYSSGAVQPWAKLNRKLTSSFSKAVAADFDGNGKSDIAVGDGQKWRYSADGRGPLTVVRDGSAKLQPYPPLKGLPIGHFDGGAQALVVSFGDFRWEERPGPYGPVLVRVSGERLFIWGLDSREFSVRSERNMR